MTGMALDLTPVAPLGTVKGTLGAAKGLGRSLEGSSLLSLASGYWGHSSETHSLRYLWLLSGTVVPKAKDSMLQAQGDFI